MSELIKKQDIKDTVVEALEPFAGAIKKDFEKVDGRFEKIEITLINIVEELKEARKERAEIKAKIDETYRTVDGFIQVVTRLEDEFVAMKEDLRRVKVVIKEKLGVDLL